MIKRKKLRLDNYDYSSQGCYFITISTNNRKNLFWNDDKLNLYGEIVRKYILMIPDKYFGVKIDNYTIMPNHIHLLITIGCDALPNDDKTILENINNTYKFKSIPTIIAAFKSLVSKEIKIYDSDINVWQKSYYDHIIKNMDDYNKTWDYIENNPNVYLARKMKENKKNFSMSYGTVNALCGM